MRQSGLRGEGSREELSEWEPGLFPGGGGLLGWWVTGEVLGRVKLKGPEPKKRGDKYQGG